ncbi:MAG: hypothetical protein WBQ37_01080 [Candidatus Competibacter sp.]
MNDQFEPDWNPRAEEVLRDPSVAYDEIRERCPVAYSDYLLPTQAVYPASGLATLPLWIR